MKPISQDDEALIHAHLREIKGAYPVRLKPSKAGSQILAADADRRAGIAARALELWIESGADSFGHIASDLLRANSQDWTSARLANVVEAAAQLHREHPAFGGFNRFPFKPLISAVEKAAAAGPLTDDLRAALEKWKAAISARALTHDEERQLGEAETIALDDNESRPWSETSAAFETMDRLQRIRTPLTEERKLIDRLSALLSQAGSTTPVIHIDTSDAVGTLVAADLAKNGRANAPGWAALLNHARSLSSNTPSRKWLETAADLADKIKPDLFDSCVADWLNEAGQPGRVSATFGHTRDATVPNDCSVELLKGLAWIVVAAKRIDLAPALGNLAEACFKKIPNKGPRNVKVANAATAALAALAHPAAAAQLSRLRQRAKHQSSRATVDKALAIASQKTGLAPDDLAEISVPAFGLDTSGIRRNQVGDYVAELRVSNAQEVALSWFSAGDLPCSSVPEKVRAGHTEQLKHLKREAKDASTMLAAQALRLEHSYLSGRNWPMPVWRERIFDHPLVGTLARRLIWQFDNATAIARNRGFVNAANQPLSPKNDATVSLWHPMHSTPAQVLVWREWLDQHEVTQPFKQAHREIYVLTDAERRTGAYSNRFAAHILRQHQLTALCQARGWDYRLQGEFDSHNVPTLNLPAQNLRAEFWAEPVANGISPQGIYLYVSSDQVRFHCPLESVPPVVFSEVMRDVDLFVSIASIGSDPAWHDPGANPNAREYWQSYAFGDLTTSARTRKEVLQQLLPRLKIAGQCRLDEKFLIVTGAFRTYKIHLGSANILMEPNNQYLCIVPDPKAAAKQTGRLFLPFEGDRTLAIILSKAFLLAEDIKIKDQTIVRQITPQP